MCEGHAVEDARQAVDRERQDREAGQDHALELGMFRSLFRRRA
ncbi:hypothetical protein [Streptomyces sp. CBMA152]|nr:hypothetical protein [Streptomyces sp. CBMA152]